MTEEQNIYAEEIRYGDAGVMAAEMDISLSRLSRIITAEPVRSFVRFIRGVRKAKPRTASKLVALALRQIDADERALVPAADWDHQTETQRFMRQVHEGLEAIHARAPVAVIRRELADIRIELDKWDAQLDAEEAERNPQRNPQREKEIRLMGGQVR